MEELEREYRIRHADVRRGLDGAVLVLEGSGEYAEDYQIRMLEENAVRGLLPVRGTARTEPACMSTRSAARSP